MCDLSPLHESTLSIRAEKLKSNAEKIKCWKYITVNDILQGNAEKNITFVANLFNHFPKVETPAANSGSSLNASSKFNDTVNELIESQADDKREERGTF